MKQTILHALHIFLLVLLMHFATTSAVAQGFSINDPQVDLEVVEKIKKEAKENSHLMKMAGWLTDVIGPRLTNSPQMFAANEWVKETLEGFGLDEVYHHEWGPFGQGWELKRFSIHANYEHGYFPVIGYPKAWSPGYDGPVSGEVVYLKLDAETDYEDYRGKLEGKFVLLDQPSDPEPMWDPFASRVSDERLLQLANATERLVPQEGRTPSAAWLARQQAAYERAQFLLEERPLAIIDETYRGWGGQVAVTGATLPAEPNTPWTQRPRPHQIDAPNPVPQISLSSEHYGRLFRLVDKGISVTLEMDLQVKFQDEELMAWNTIGEIKGTDPDIGDEVVIIGAHLDSWHTGTGATDNASGSVVMMEAMRILKALDLQPRRTIQIALWSGEEQGLIGSREYVREFFAESAGNEYQSNAVIPKDEFEKFSAYYNVDNGTGQIRGIYLQQNDAIRNLFRTWLIPFEDWGTATVSWANTGSTDHVSFDRMGLPGFQFIQDPMEYFTLSHHSNMDTYERLVEKDLIRNAIIAASFAWHTAMMDERLPRKDDVEVVTDAE